MIRSTALFFQPGHDEIVGMVTKTFEDITVCEARMAMIDEVACYREQGPLKGCDMTVQAAEVVDDQLEGTIETSFLDHQPQRKTG